ncbi:MAG: hypothetical protein GY853_08010 [PVC group bacterium]|nr:hypothetical protein [PVC group bacterium]
MKKISAFTLIEMIVVLGIIVMIISMTSAYLFNYRSGTALKNCAKEIKMVLEQAKSLAITTQDKHGVAFDYGPPSQYYIFKKVDTVITLIGSTYETRDGIIVDGASTTLGFDSDLGKDAALFNSRGGLSGGQATIYLKDSGGTVRTIGLNNVTGYIKI